MASTGSNLPRRPSSLLDVRYSPLLDRFALASPIAAPEVKAAEDDRVGCGSEQEHEVQMHRSDRKRVRAAQGVARSTFTRSRDQGRVSSPPPASERVRVRFLPGWRADAASAAPTRGALRQRAMLEQRASERSSSLVMIRGVICMDLGTASIGGCRIVVGRGGGDAVIGRRLVALSGMLAVALVVGALLSAGGARRADRPVHEVLSRYGRDEARQVVPGILLCVGALLFLVFTGTLAKRLRGSDSRFTSLQALFAGGGVLVVAGLTVFGVLAVTSGRVSEHLDSSRFRAFHGLHHEMSVPLTAGTAAFMLGAGAAIFQSSLLPDLLGWLAIAVATVAATPSELLGGALDHASFFAVGGLGAWTVVVSAMLAASPDAWRPPGH